MTGQQGSLKDAAWDPEEWHAWRLQTTEELQEHAAAVASILDILENEGEGGPLHWETMKPARRTEVMKQLDAFVHFLDRTYFQYLATYSLKPCWWQHPDVVWQLTALWAAFRVAYSPSARSGTAQADFHERYLWPILERLYMSSLKECNSREHKPALQEPLGASRDLDQQLEQWKEGNDVGLGAFKPDKGDDGDSAGVDAGGVLSDEPPADDARVADAAGQQHGDVARSRDT